ncbi:MAG: 3-hydroxyacyl-CoA dehydrogenase family protein [Candidatus Acidiferrales bacterium]
MQIKSIAVIGAGPLGRDIALLSARAGYPTVLEDVNAETIERALDAIRAGEMSAGGRDAAMSRLSTSRSIEDAMRAAELIIDTTLDELETKLEVFTIFDKFARPGAILASCTASLSVSEIATITFRAERCVATRFTGFAPRLKRVEIVRSSQTAEEVVAECAEAGRRMGLEVVISFEQPESKRELETR